MSATTRVGTMLMFLISLTLLTSVNTLAMNECPLKLSANRDIIASGKFVCSCMSTQNFNKTTHVWGTDVYTDDSDICKAALHAGALKSEGGLIEITASDGLKSYASSTRHGITSTHYGYWPRSFTVTSYHVTPTPTTTPTTTPSSTSSVSASPTPSASVSLSATPSSSTSATATATTTASPSSTVSTSVNPTSSVTMSPSSSSTATASITPTPSSSLTPAPSSSASSTVTPTASTTPTPTSTSTPTSTPTRTPTRTPSRTPTPSASRWPSIVQLSSPNFPYYPTAFHSSYTVDSGYKSVICGQKSTHDNGKEDRQYKWATCDVLHSNRFSVSQTRIRPSMKPNVFPTKYDGQFFMECPAGTLLHYIHSNVNIGARDRQFEMYCVRLTNTRSYFNRCNWNGGWPSLPWENRWDRPVDFSCPANMGLAGIESVHNNGHEDRRFKFKCCELASYPN